MTKFNCFDLLSRIAFFFVLVPLQLAAGEEQDAGGTPPELSSKFELPEPGLFLCDTDVYIFRFSMSDAVENYMLRPRLSRGETCEVDIYDKQNYLVPNLVFDEAPFDPAGGSVRQVAYTLDPDTALIGSSPIYSTSPDGSTGTLKFCIGLDIYLADNVTLVNWRNVEYIQSSTLSQIIGTPLSRELKPQLDNGFSSSQSERRLSSAISDCTNGGYEIVFENWWEAGGGIVVEPVNITDGVLIDDNDGTGGNDTGTGGNDTGTGGNDDGTGGNDNGTGGNPFLDIIEVTPDVITGGFFHEVQYNISFSLDAFICDENNEQTTMPVYQQGDLFRLCIKPDNSAQNTGLFIQSLDFAYYSKPTTSGTDLVQYAVEGGQVDSLLSSLQCATGSALCAVQTILKADFFATQGDVELSGVARLQFGSDPIRRALNSDQRELQQSQGPQERGGFNIKFPVTTFEETFKFKYAKKENENEKEKSDSLSVIQAILLVVLSFVFVMNCVFTFWIRQSRRIHNADQREDQFKNRISKAKGYVGPKKKSQEKTGYLNGSMVL